LIRRFRLLRQAEHELDLARNWYDEQRYGLGLVFFDAFEGAVEHAQVEPTKALLQRTCVRALEGHAIDVVHEVDPQGRNTQGSHPGCLAKGLGRLLREFSVAKLVESLRDALGVLGTGLNENVDVLRRGGGDRERPSRMPRR
jgi:hypothetical protein